VSLYESHFATDWEDVDRDEASRRAYAIGVAEKLGEHNREELEALYEAVETNYARSIVELAYQEGRQEASEVTAADREKEAVWTDLIEGETTEIVAPESLLEGRDGIPEAMGIGELLDRMDTDTTEAVDRPDFLDR